MYKWKTPKLALVLVVTTLVFGATSSANAFGCLDNLFSWFRHDSPPSITTYNAAYAPYATSVCAPTCGTSCGTVCATPQTCMYTPQTYYRTVYRTVPTTRYMAVNSCDPCTGCPTVAYRPVTTYVRSQQLIPYTTYQAVWSPVCGPCSTTSAYGVSCGTTCGPCATGSCGWTSTIDSGCTSCQAAPATSYEDSGNLQPQPAAAPPATYGSPTNNGSFNSGSSNGGWQNNGNGGTTVTVPSPATTPQKTQKPVENRPLSPIPEPEANRPNGTTTQINSTPSTLPRLFQSGDRTAARPVIQASYSRPIPPRVSSDGWRPSKR